MKFFGVVSSLAVLIGATQIFDVFALPPIDKLFFEQKLLPEFMYENGRNRFIFKEITVPPADHFDKNCRDWLTFRSNQLNEAFGGYFSDIEDDVELNGMSQFVFHAKGEFALQCLYFMAILWMKEADLPQPIQQIFKRIQLSALLRLAFLSSDVQQREMYSRQAIDMIQGESADFVNSVVSCQSNIYGLLLPRNISNNTMLMMM